MIDIKRNIEVIKENIEKCRSVAGTKEVTLIAVTKYVEVSLMKQAQDCGVLEFGENKVQEFMEKKDFFTEDIRWNLIGRLQTNKVKYIIDSNIALIHSLDRITLAQELQNQCAKANKTIDVLLQINVSKEDTKTGVFEEDIERFLDEMQQFDKVKIQGMMTMAPYTTDSKYLREIFASAKTIYEKHKTADFKYLSMGMSSDYKEAILEGANVVRVGSAIFKLD